MNCVSQVMRFQGLGPLYKNFQIRITLVHISYLYMLERSIMIFLLLLLVLLICVSSFFLIGFARRLSVFMFFLRESLMDPIDFFDLYLLSN